MDCNSDLKEEQIDFSTLILSLSSTVLIALGEIPDPDSGKLIEDLCSAKETIQIIELLQEKTRGNLTSNERELINSILVDLRLKYVKKSKK